MAGGPICEFRVGWTAGAAIIKVRSACQQGVWQEAIGESGSVFGNVEVNLAICRI